MTEDEQDGIIEDDDDDVGDAVRYVCPNCKNYFYGSPPEVDEDAISPLMVNEALGLLSMLMPRPGISCPYCKLHFEYAGKDRETGELMFAAKVFLKLEKG